MDQETNADILFFTSNHCAPCMMMKRKLEALNAEMPFVVKTVNIESADKTTLQGFRMAPVIKIKDEVVVGDVEIDDLRNVLMRNLYSSRGQ
nr:hypothetical protein [Candidatus Sigynarchaeota archaeon]